MVTLAAPVDSSSILAAAKKGPPPVEPLFYNQAFQFDLRDALNAITGILVVHGDCDEVIPPAHARVIHESVEDPKKYLIIPGGDHRLSRRDHQERFMEETLDWFRPLINH